MTVRITLAAAAATFAFASPALAAGIELPVDGIRMESPHPYVNGRRGGEVWSDVLVRPAASAISVYFQHLDLGDDDYLVVDNGEDQWIFTAADGEGFWTDAFPGHALRLSIVAAPGSHGDGVVIDRYRVSYAPDPTQSVYRRNDMVPIAKAPAEVYDNRGPVARVYMEGVGYCTGFLIGRDLLMTNNHCVDSQSMCSRTSVQLGYEDDASGAPLPYDTYNCAELLETDHELDYSVLRLDASPGRQYGFYDLADRTPLPNEQGAIVQHPAGARKAAAVPEDCALGGVADGNGAETDFRHQCDTQNGSSGSPVLTQSFSVIGLHHFGGAGWMRASANQAVRMDRILEICANCGG